MLRIHIPLSTFSYQMMIRKAQSFPLEVCFPFKLKQHYHCFLVCFFARILLMRSCAFYPKFGFGAFGIFPVLLKNRLVRFFYRPGLTCLSRLVNLHFWHDHFECLEYLQKIMESWVWDMAHQISQLELLLCLSLVRDMQWLANFSCLNLWFAKFSGPDISFKAAANGIIFYLFIFFS